MSDEQVPYSDTAFGDHFRGSPQEIRRRLSVYLPLLDEVRVKDIGLPLLDLGFGRGEWLEMLAGLGYPAIGIDASEEAVARGRQAGLDVAQAELFEDLRQRPDASLSGVTAFHVIEHVHPGRLGELLAEIHRVLAPGGLTILETPNPENVIVGSKSFYLDPEHVRPVPPDALEFHAVQAGFAHPWIARVNRETTEEPLSEVPGDVPGALEVNALVYAVNGLRFAAPDYALIAVKPSGQSPTLEPTDFERLFGPQPLGLSEYRLRAAEEAARKFWAENVQLQERSAQLEREASTADHRAAEATHRALAAESRAHAAAADLATVSSSLSWRVTAPLRAVSAVVRGATGTPGVGQDGSPKRYAKLAVGYPMRWALSRPRLGPALDRQLVKVPIVEHKVRIAIHEVTTVRVTRDASDDLPPDLAAVPEHARGVFTDLERAAKDPPA